MRTVTRVAIGLIGVVAGCARPAETLIAAPGAPALAIPPTAAELRRDLMVFASDSFRGRETGTPDERRAAAFLVGRLARIGLDPAGDSGYLQRVPLVRMRLGAGTRFAVQARGVAAPGRLVTGLVPLIALGDRASSPRPHVEGELVFAGYGVTRAGGGDDNPAARCATAGSSLLPRRWPRDDHPQLLAGARFSAMIDVDRTPVESYNVIAALPGRDPDLQRSWVAFGAHYDHLGILPAVRGDSVAHGADDDGSGSVALLAIARAMRQAPRPRRSVLFVWHTGEEEGLLGSAYFASHPVVPLDSIVALINVDMVGRNAPESLYVVGLGVAPHGTSRALGGVVDSVNASLAAPFAFDRAWDTPTNPQRIYSRGDAFPYAERGVPIAFFTSGLHADYQQASDEPSRIDYSKLAHVSQLLYQVGEALANRDARPR